MKSIRIMLLGIAIILLGVACGVSLYVLINGPGAYGSEVSFFKHTALFLPWIGIAITIYGLLKYKE